VDAVASGGTVHVAAGRYAENVVVPRGMTILGPNADKDGCDTGRVAEAILMPATNQPNDGVAGCVVMELQAGHVTVDGLMFDGHNPGLGTGYNMAG